MLADLRPTLRLLARSPGFSAVAVLSIALGLAANTAVFSFVVDVFFRPLPLADPDSLVVVWNTPPDRSIEVTSASAEKFLRWQEAAHSFEAVSALRGQPWFLTPVSGPAQRARGVAVTSRFFDVFRLRFAHGRGFSEQNFQAGQEQVAVLTHRFWRQHFGGDPAAIGRTIRLNATPHLIIGVLAPENTLGGNLFDVFTPLLLDTLPGAQRSLPLFIVHGRLKAGVGRAQAQAEMDVLAARLARAFPETSRGHGIAVRPIQQWIGFGSEDQRSVVVLFVGAACLQLIVCANLANLLLSRAVARRGEIAVRAALGASPFQLLRPILAEALILSLAGGALGVLLAAWLSQALVPFMPSLGLGQSVHVTLDATVILFALGAAIATALLFGLLPAWLTSRVDLNDVLKAATRGGTADLRRRRIGQWLVAAEIAVAMVLVVAGSLTVQTLWRLQHAPTGVAVGEVAYVTVRCPPASYQKTESLAQFWSELTRRTAALPGVVSSTVASGVPLAYGASRTFTVAGRAPLAPADRPQARVHFGGADYARTFGLPLRQGRDLAAADRLGQPRAALINQAFADRYFSGANPLGARLQIDLPSSGSPASDTTAPWEIVGVVGNVISGGAPGSFTPAIILSFGHAPATTAVVAVRTPGPPRLVLPRLRDAVTQLDPTVLTDDLETLADFLAGFRQDDRHRAAFLGGLAGLALFLAGLGVFGVVSYTVNQRRREFGLRLALGAQPGDLYRLIFRQSALLAATGCGAGLLASVAAGHLLRSLLFGVGAIDPGSLAGAALLLTTVTVLASVGPARRAMRVDPTAVLRTE